MPRVPTASDFPSLTVGVTPNPEAGAGRPPANVLVLLHGLGDTEAPFTNLGRQLNLPSTCVLSVRGPQPLPFDLGGFHWGDDITVNQGDGGSLDPDAGFKMSTRTLLEKIVKKALVESCGFTPRQIIFWGFGQGGMAALSVASEMEPATADSSQTPTGELGGVITIGGPLPEGIVARTKDERKCRTPILVLGGSGGSVITDEQADRIKRVFDFVERVKWKRSGDSMPRDRGEMTPIMQFLARRLRVSAPEGTEEIG